MPWATKEHGIWSLSDLRVVFALATILRLRLGRNRLGRAVISRQSHVRLFKLRALPMRYRMASWFLFSYHPLRITSARMEVTVSMGGCGADV